MEGLGSPFFLLCPLVILDIDLLFTIGRGNFICHSDK